MNTKCFQVSLKEANAKEVHYIKKLNTFAHGGHGYNLTLGGAGITMTKVIRKKIGASVSAAWRRPEVRKKFSATNAAMRAKVSMAHKIRLQDPVELEKLAASQRKRYQDPKERAKSSVAQVQAWADPVKRARKELANRARWGRPEERAKASESALRRWDRPGQREHASKVSTGRGLGVKLPESTKLKMSESKRRRDCITALCRSGWGCPWRLLGLDTPVRNMVERMVETYA